MSNNKQYHRRSIRLQGYDYTQNGAYFVTICAHERLHLFGKVVDGNMHLNDWGMFVRSCWHEIPSHHPYIELDAFVVMPNHMHGVIVIAGDNGVMIDTTGDDRRGMIDTTGDDRRGMIDTTGDDRRGMIDTTGDDRRGMIDTTGDDRRGMIYHAPTDIKREFSKPIAHSLSSIVGTFKAAVTRHIKRQPNAPDHPIWQRNYYEHIIRSEESLNTIRSYVATNPTKWVEDSLHNP